MAVEVFCLGDSLTEAEWYTSGLGIQSKMTYQYWLKKALDHSSLVVHNFGVSGQTIEEISLQLRRVEIHHELKNTHLILMGGTNNFWRESNEHSPKQPDIDLIEKVVGKIKEILTKTIEEKGIPAKNIVLCTVPLILVVPGSSSEKMLLNIVETNLRIVKVAQELGVKLCDIYSHFLSNDPQRVLMDDGVHFTLDGNKVTGESLADIIFQ